MALPPGLADHLNLDGPPATPRPSATVLLMRGEDPWELLMIRRPGGADFAPGAYVFPGGTVHEDDRIFEDPLRAAAVRELFEEVGIVLAPNARDADCAALRKLLEAGSSFGPALDELGLAPAFDELVMFARWVTPAQLRRRFDARFYLARLPEGQSVRPQAGEVADWLWIAPADAIVNPDITLVYATRTVLESVADAQNVSTLLARARAIKEIPTVEPRVVQTERGWEILRD